MVLVRLVISNIQKEDLLKPVFRVNIVGIRRTSLVKENNTFGIFEPDQTAK